MKLTVWIGIGSNVGDRNAAIAEAARRLAMRLDEFRLSSPIETPAVDRHGAPDPASPAYLNAAATGLFPGTPRELFSLSKTIEIEMGRPPEEKSRYLPRVIDLDILLIEANGRNLTLDEPDLIVPHPRLLERPFCLAPLLELGLDARRLLTGAAVQCSNPAHG